MWSTELPILHPLDLGDGEVAGAPVWEVEAVDARGRVRLEDALDAPELVAAALHLDARVVLRAHEARPERVWMPSEAVLGGHALGGEEGARGGLEGGARAARGREERVNEPRQAVVQQQRGGHMRGEHMRFKRK